MSRKKTSAKVVLPGITPSNQGEMGAVLLGFASALMSNSSMEDAYEKAPATASGSGGISRQETTQNAGQLLYLPG
jgi:hypothetical protein